MKKSICVLLVSLLACAWTASAQAAGVALLPVTIDPASQMPEDVREQCRLDYQLQNDILAGLQHYDSAAATTTDASKGEALRVTITYVLGIGGGSWTGPKVIAVKMEYLNDGKVEFTAKMRRRSGFGGFHGTCALLDGASKGLGRNIAKWAQHPKTNLKEEDDPDAPARSEKGARPSVVNGIDPDAEAPVAEPAASAAK